MKVKVLNNMGSLVYGEIKEAVMSANRAQVAVFDSQNCGWFLYTGQFEVIEEDSSFSSDSKKSFVSLRELLGQDVNSIQFR